MQVGPAEGSQSWLTAKMLVWLKRLNASAITCTWRRSPKLIALAMRISNWKKPGMEYLSRPRVPVQPAGGVIPGIEKGTLWLVRHWVASKKAAPGIYGSVVAPGVPMGTMLGRIEEAPRSRRVSSLVMMLKGRPEETSIRGATVKLLKKARVKDSPDLWGED